MGDGYNKTTVQLNGGNVTSWNLYAGYRYGSNTEDKNFNSAIVGGSVSIPIKSNNITLLESQVTGSIGDLTAIRNNSNLTYLTDSSNYKFLWGPTVEVGAGYTNYTNGGQETRVNAGVGLKIADSGADYVYGGYGTSKSLGLIGGIEQTFTGNKKESSLYGKLRGELNFPNNMNLGGEVTMDKSGLAEAAVTISYNF